MDGYTKFYTAGQDDDRHFSKLLSSLCQSLKLPMPVFRGKRISSEPGLKRWEIETKLVGRSMAPITSDVVYKEIYKSWSTGVEQAMHGAISRLCFQYRGTLPRQLYSHFGRRTMDGTPVWYEARKEKMTTCAIQLMDMECVTVYV